MKLQINEPGLIMTPPDKGSAFNDGVLKSSEIKNLNLDAELVILSTVIQRQVMMFIRRRSIGFSKLIFLCWS